MSTNHELSTVILQKQAIASMTAIIRANLATVAQ